MWSNFLNQTSSSVDDCLEPNDAALWQASKGDIAVIDSAQDFYPAKFKFTNIQQNHNYLSSHKFPNDLLKSFTQIILTSCQTRAPATELGPAGQHTRLTPLSFAMV